jgi:hypothetical protein
MRSESDMPALPDDYARCHDDRCEPREHCLRWLHRNDDRPRTVHNHSLRPLWQSHDDLCDHAITSLTDVRATPEHP